MGYWGTIVVARARGLLVDQEGVAGFGHEYVWLRELGDGWQLLETTGFDDPPDLLAPCTAVAEATGHPVLAAYVSDSYCAVLATAVAGRVGPLTHLGAVGGACGAFRHQPHGLPGPGRRRVGEVVAELVAWSEAAGLRADPRRARAAVSRAAGAADDQVFALVEALGVDRIGRTLPWSLPVYDWPFSSFMRSYGPAFQARANAKERVTDPFPAEPWEAAALALEAELWAALYRTGVDVVALARRAARLKTEYDAARGRETRERVAALLAAFEAGLADGAPGWSAEADARAAADARATGR